MAKFCSFKEASNTGWYLLLGWEVGKSSFVQNWPLQCCSAGRSGKPCNSLSTYWSVLQWHVIMVLTSLQEFNRERKEVIKASKNAIARVSFLFSSSSCVHRVFIPLKRLSRKLNMARIHKAIWARRVNRKWKFFVIGKLFCSNVRANRVYKSKET